MMCYTVVIVAKGHINMALVVLCVIGRNVCYMEYIISSFVSCKCVVGRIMVIKHNKLNILKEMEIMQALRRTH